MAATKVATPSLDEAQIGRHRGFMSVTVPLNPWQ